VAETSARYPKELLAAMAMMDHRRRWTGSALPPIDKLLACD
jgi:hypothetical protein